MERWAGPISTHFYGPEPDHGAAAEHIPRGCVELDLGDCGNGATKNAGHRDATGPKRMKNEEADELRSTTMNCATKTIHAGQPSEPETGSLIAPIFQTSTYEQESPGHDKGFNYSRTNNPTRARLETVLAELEGVSHAALFASGLAAENAVLQAYLRPGDEIVISLDVYGGTYRILNKVFQPLGVKVAQLDASDLGVLEKA